MAKTDSNIGSLKRASYLAADSLLIAEQQGEALAVEGALIRDFARQAVEPQAVRAENSEKNAAAAESAAAGFAAQAESAMNSVQDALDNLPEGDTLIINDLTTGGKAAALSAEMGKNLNTRLIKTETPSLTEEQKKQLKDLVGSYTTRRTKFKYEGNVIRNVYVGDSDNNKPFVEHTDGEGIKSTRIAINCGLFCSLLWAGVHPQKTFVDYLDNQGNFTGNLNKYFDWGYEFKFPNRRAYGVKKFETDKDGNPVYWSDGEQKYTLYGFLQPYGEGDLTGASSYNSYYSPGSGGHYSQKFYTYATAADMAWELYTNGYEIPMKDIEVGDLLFFRARSLSDELDDYDENFRFRNITHVGMVSDVTFVNGQKVWSIAESTPMIGTDYAVANLQYSSDNGATLTRLVSLNNHICMVARHPAAFGAASNVGTKFTKI